MSANKGHSSCLLPVSLPQTLCPVPLEGCCDGGKEHQGSELRGQGGAPPEGGSRKGPLGPSPKPASSRLCSGLGTGKLV